MPAGPIGSVWSLGSWSDLAWEENTWADAVIPPTPTGDEVPFLFIGVVTTLVAGTIYGLPTRRCIAYIQQSGGIIEFSNDGLDFADIVLDANGQLETGGGFIKAVDENAIIKLKVQ